MKKTSVLFASFVFLALSGFAYAGENSEKISDWKSWICTEEIIMSLDFSRELCHEPNQPHLPTETVKWKFESEPILISWGYNIKDQLSVENIRVALRTDYGWVVGKRIYFDFLSGGGQLVIRLYSDKEKKDQIAERLIILTPRGIR